MKNLINKEEVIDVLIIGGGPAGMTSAVYTARGGMKTIIVEKGAPGGKMIKTEEIENYPGFETILGPDLAMKMLSQTQALGTEFIYDEVVDVEKQDDRLFKVCLASGRQLFAYAVIVATGSKENELGVPGEAELYGHGVSYCAVCDGAFHKGKPVAVVGGGYSAVQEATYLSQMVGHVYVIVRKDYFRADNKQVERLKAKSNVTFLMEHEVNRVYGDKTVTGINVHNNRTGEDFDLEITAFFPYIGSTPVTQFLTKNKITNASGYIEGTSKMETTISGLYVAGDVREVPLRQIAIAAGDGAMAGQMALQYVQDIK